MYKYIIIGLIFIIILAILIIDNQYIYVKSNKSSESCDCKRKIETFTSNTTIEVPCENIKKLVLKNHNDVFGKNGLNKMDLIKKQFSNLNPINNSIQKMRKKLNEISEKIKEGNNAENKHNKIN